MKNRLKILMAEKSTREDRRMSLRIVSHEAGVPMHTLRGMYSGKIQAISIESLNALANYFECSLDDLFIREDSSGNVAPALAAA
jgi:DNA-binding Xre family transcriptional regulator